MNICIDCRYLGQSGIGTYCQNLLNAFVTNKNHRFVIIVNKSLPEFDKLDNVVLQYCNIKPFSIKEFFCMNWGMVNRCDVFISPYFNISLGIKIPLYITIHDMLFMDNPNIVNKLGYYYRKLYLKLAIKKTKSIFTVSEFSKQRIMYHFGNTKPINVVCNVVSEKIKHIPTIYCDKEDYFIFVGNVKSHKGLITLLKAFRLAKKDGLTSKLKIVGETDSFRTKDKKISAMIGKINDVEFTGRVSDETLIDLVRKAKALVQPSLYEGFGIPPMEALYLGTNAIISDIDVFKEIYINYPVTYFKVEDFLDLKEKLLEFKNIDIDIEKVRNMINERFSMKRTIEIMTNELCKHK